MLKIEPVGFAEHEEVRKRRARDGAEAFGLRS